MVCLLAEDVGAFARPSTQRNSVWRRSKRQLRALMNRYVNCPVSRSNGKLVQVSAFYEKSMSCGNMIQIIRCYGRNS